MLLNKFYRVNDYIRSPQLRVIGPDGEQLGVLTKYDALTKAKELEMDLIEVASSANPPVARILDYQKFKYEESKKSRGIKKSSGGELKELWLSPRIADHDLGVRLNQAEKFLLDGQKVKLTVKFKGREMAFPKLGYDVLKQAILMLEGKATVEKDPKFEGRKLSMIITKGKVTKVPEAQISPVELPGAINNKLV